MPDTKDMKPKVHRTMDLLVQRRAAAHAPITITQGWRSAAYQNQLWQIGRDAHGNVIGHTVTDAKGGQSLHEFGVAFDCAFVKPTGEIWWPSADIHSAEYAQYWAPLVADAAFLGLEHGDRGYWDCPHFEMRLGYSLADFQTHKIDESKFA